jgi:2-dehydropantoate 2-reductase
MTSGRQTIAVLGPGGVGGFLAATLTRAGEDVTVVARQSTAAVIERDGLRVQSAALNASFETRPRTTSQSDTEVDILFIATKAVGLEQALDRITATPRVVVPLLNGLDHLDLLRTRFGADHVVAATIRIEADRPEPARIVQTSPSLRIELAADDAALAERLPAVAAMLEAAELTVAIGDSERRVMWSKLVRLNALASTTSAADEQLGFIRCNPVWREALLACVHETAAVANADGGRVDSAATISELENAHASLGSSMQRDIAAGRTPELDAIQGSVLRAGARHGIRCPTVARLAAAIAQRAGIKPPSY